MGGQRLDASDGLDASVLLAASGWIRDATSEQDAREAN
jgi:hypothetical protein